EAPNLKIAGQDVAIDWRDGDFYLAAEAKRIRNSGRALQSIEAGIDHFLGKGWWCAPNPYQAELALNFDGIVEVGLLCGRADILNHQSVWEVEPLCTWREGLQQALAFAYETGLRATLALHEPPEWRDLERAARIRKTLVRMHHRLKGRFDVFIRIDGIW